MSVRQFPVLYHKRKHTDPDRRRSVPWDMLVPFEENALSFHGQTLQRLAERGGLGPGEMVAIIRNDKKWWKLDETEASWLELDRLVAEHEGPQPATELEFLRWLHGTIALSDPEDMKNYERLFVEGTGKKLPSGY